MLVTNASTKRWTREEFRRLYESGFFDPEERVELIEGEIVIMTPPGPEHTDPILYGTPLLVGLYGGTHLVGVQVPLNLGLISEPQPDFSLVAKGSVSRGALPTTADLVIEVSYSSLAYDRKEKLELYAKAGIPEYWIINVAKREVEAFRDPGPGQESPGVYTFACRTLYLPEQAIQPLMIAGPACPLSEFFG
jgi:Uma2 family endonuclease